MNERIKELAEQAGLGYVMQPGNPYIQEDLAKFAKLIIDDCEVGVKVMQRYYDNPGYYEPESYYVRMKAKAEAMQEAVEFINNFKRGITASFE